MLYTAEELDQVVVLLKVLVAIQSFRLGKDIFDTLYRMILKYAS